MIHQCLYNFTNPRGTNWVNQVSHVQLAINATPGDSTGSSPFKIIYGWNFYLLPAVRIYPTNVSFANEHVSSLLTVQQEAHKVLELARVHQTKVSWDRLKPAPPLIPGQDTVLVHSLLYLKVLGKKAKITLPWIGPFPVHEGPNENYNCKVQFGPMILSVQPWVARSQLKLYLFPDQSMYAIQCFPRPEPIEVEGDEARVVEQIVDDRKKNCRHQFLVYWKGHLEHLVT
jgi:hypothetical protein